MTRASALTVALIAKRPLTAAKALDSMTPGDAATFILALPVAQAVTVVSLLSAWRASTLLRALGPANGARIVAQMEYQSAASVLRLVPESERQLHLDALPKKLSRNLRSTLTYAADTVGANMSAVIVSIHANQTVADALAEMRLIRRARAGVVCVVDDAKRLRGALNTSELLQLPGEARLRDVMDHSIPTLSARARLTSVVGLSAWEEYAQLPVVNRQKQVIGALSRRVALRVPAELGQRATATDQTSILGSMANAFATSVLGLSELLADTSETPQVQGTNASPIKSRARV